MALVGQGPDLCQRGRDRVYHADAFVRYAVHDQLVLHPAAADDESVHVTM